MDVSADLSESSPSLVRGRALAQVALVLLATAVLRVPSFRWSVISDDEAIYDAMAQTVNAGGVMYRDAVDHKPPGLVYVYAAVERWAGPHASTASRMGAVHLLGLLAALLTSLGLFGLARPRLRELAWVPPLLYALASTAKCAYDGLAVNGELLMNVPTVFAVWAVLVALESKGARRFALDVCAGALVGVAGLFKWQAMVTGLAFPFFGSHADPTGFWSRVLRRGPAWLVGLFLPLVATGAYFRAHHLLDEAWQWGGLFNLRYISDGPGLRWALKRLGLQLAATVVPSIALYVAGTWGLIREARRRSSESAGWAVWAVASLLCLGIGGRFFGHYFLQAELPLCVLAALPLARIFARAPRTTVAVVALPALVFFVLACRPQLTRAIFDPGQPDWERIGQRIWARSAPGDTLFVWGNVPPLYPLSELPMGTRFSFCNYLTGLSPGTPSEYLDVAPSDALNEAWPLLLDDLARRRPTWILDTAVAGWKGYGKFPMSRYGPFEAYVSAHYRKTASIDGAALLRRVD